MTEGRRYNVGRRIDGLLIGRIFEIKRFAVHDGPGIRTTIFFKGCPLGCSWCHNPEGIDGAPEIALLDRLCVGCGECLAACPRGLHALDESGRHAILRDGGRCDMCLSCVNACMPQALKLYGTEYGAEELFKIAAEDADFYRQSGGGVTCSGGEPLMQADFAAEFLRLCKGGGLHTAVDTSGHAAWHAVAKVMPFTDIFLYDIKHMDPREHKALTGADNRLILENLANISKCGVPIEIRMPVIPGLNDSEQNIVLTARFLAQINTLTQIRVLQYHAYAFSKYASIGRPSHLPAATGGERAAAARVADILSGMGLPVVGPE